jgi:hypothetical protein
MPMKMMRSVSIVLAAAAVVGALTLPADADGVRVRRAARYYVGEISRNVITPYYVGYYGAGYSYYKPDPIPRPVYWQYPVSPDCWAWAPYGRRYFVCEPVL